MNANEYQKLAMRTLNPALTDAEALLDGALGLCAEAGEFADLLKKHRMQGHPLDRARLAQELGDVAWHLAEAADALGCDLDAIFQMNLDKLRRRYPDGFDVRRSLCRADEDSAAQTEPETDEGYIRSLRRVVGHRTLIMPCACAILTDGEGRVLLQRRADDGNWSYHGGAVEIDERVEDAMRREVREELNLELDEVELFGIYSGPASHHVYPNGDEVSSIDIVYLCGKFHGELALQESEVREVAWFAPDALPPNLSANTRRALADYAPARSSPPRD